MLKLELLGAVADGIQCKSVVYLGDTSCFAKNGTKTVKSSYTDAAVALLNG